MNSMSSRTLDFLRQLPGLLILLAAFNLPAASPVESWLTTADLRQTISPQTPLAFTNASGAVPDRIEIDDTTTFQTILGLGSSLEPTTCSNFWRMSPADRASAPEGREDVIELGMQERRGAEYSGQVTPLGGDSPRAQGRREAQRVHDLVGDWGGTESGGSPHFGGSPVSAAVDLGGTQAGGTQAGGTQSGGTQSGGTQPGGTQPGGTQAHLGAPLPEARVVPAERTWGVSEIIEEVPGSKFVSFLKISAKRAFRLRIEPTEVLPAERAALESAYPPIADPNLQAFLAWRRSVLFLVGCALIPLTVIGFLDGILVGQATPIRVVKLAPVIAEGLFLAICWSQLRHWAHWRKQRRMLLIGWFLFMGTPFIVFLYPLRTVFEGQINAEDVKALNLGAISRSLLPFKITMIAMLQLAPKAISLMPGLVRASLVIKLLFPGSTAPGWLIVVAAPIYALLAYVILIVPYQFTGSGWFIGGVIGIIAGQILVARSGFALATPMSEAEALYKIKRVRKFYLITMISSAVLIVIALGSLVAQLKLHPLDVILSVLKFEANVLILTLIGADLVITNLDRARKATLGRDHVEDQAEAKIAAFVSLDAPHVPPPSGPAPIAR